MSETTLKVPGYSIPKIVREKVEEAEKVFPLKIGVSIEAEGNENKCKQRIEIRQLGKSFFCGEDDKCKHDDLKGAAACCAARIAADLVK